MELSQCNIQMIEKVKIANSNTAFSWLWATRYRTRTSAVAERPLDALCHWKFC